MKTQLLTLSIACLTAINAFGWGRIGHDAVAYIAECHLTPTAKTAIESYLDGRSIVYYASWMDYVRNTDEYNHTTKWHVNYADENGNLTPNLKLGDNLTALNAEIKKLQNLSEQTDSTVATAIKMIVHLVGDMHCPSHIYYSHLPQSKYPVKYNSTTTYGFHEYWDSKALELMHNWQYTEFQHQLDRASDKEIKQIIKGNPETWAADQARCMTAAYEGFNNEQPMTKNESRLFMMRTAEFAERQVQLAAYRLAHVLNSLFDPKYKF